MTAKGRINAASLTVGTRILVTKDRALAIGDSLSGSVDPIYISRVKRGALVATVTRVQAVMIDRGNRRNTREYDIQTDLGFLGFLVPIQTMWLAPEEDTAPVPELVAVIEVPVAPVIAVDVDPAPVAVEPELGFAKEVQELEERAEEVRSTWQLTVDRVTAEEDGDGRTADAITDELIRRANGAEHAPVIVTPAPVIPAQRAVNAVRAVTHQAVMASLEPGSPVKFPEGTPEYAAYFEELKVELDKFAKSEAPYERQEWEAPAVVATAAGIIREALDRTELEATAFGTPVQTYVPAVSDRVTFSPGGRVAEIVRIEMEWAKLYPVDPRHRGESDTFATEGLWVALDRLTPATRMVWELPMVATPEAIWEAEAVDRIVIDAPDGVLCAGVVGRAHRLIRVGHGIHLVPFTQEELDAGAGPDWSENLDVRDGDVVKVYGTHYQATIRYGALEFVTTRVKPVQVPA